MAKHHDKLRVWQMRLNQIADEMDQTGFKTSANHIDLIVADLIADQVIEAEVIYKKRTG
jgi:hypothetical protein